MGRHRDADSLQFIEWLKKKGDELGYNSEIECSIGENAYDIDVVWKYQETDFPLITFEVETSNTNTVYKNILKIFGTRTSKVKKPFYHFEIILKNKLTSAQREPLSQIIEYNNISLYENILKDSGKKIKLENELNNLVLNPLEKNPVLSFFRSTLIMCIRKMDYFFNIFGYELPFLLKDDFVPFQEKHIYEKSPEIIEHLRKRLYQIKFLKDMTRVDLDLLLQIVKLLERLDGKENCCLSNNICPKCGSKLIQKVIHHGGTEYDPEPYATTYIDGCESCDYILNEETI